MSFFEDDFYSTKVSKWRKRNRGWILGVRNQEKWLIAIAACCLGIGLTLSLVYIGAEEEPLAAQAIPVASYHNANDSVVQIAESVMPTVVSIISSAGENQVNGDHSMGIGSGVIYDKQGSKARVVTNNHVVEDGAHVEVILASGERKKATVLGRDSISDLAVLEVDAAGIKKIAEFGNSDELKPGETAIAIGNPLGLGFSQSITTGVISWPNRKIPISFGNDGGHDWEFDVIQTDAAINQGNSGGALVNLNGKVIGINSMKVSDTGVEGIGFAIPINHVKTTVESLVVHGKVKRPFMGVTTIELDAKMSGASVLKLPEQVKTGLIVLESVNPAKEAGLQTNDVIVELDGTPIATTLALRKFLYYDKKIGDKIKVTYYRNGKKLTLTMTLAESKKE